MRSKREVQNLHRLVLRRETDRSNKMVHHLVLQEVIEIIDEYSSRSYGADHMPQQMAVLREGLHLALNGGHPFHNMFGQHIPMGYPIEELRNQINYLVNRINNMAVVAPNSGNNAIIIQVIQQTGATQMFKDTPLPQIAGIAATPSPPDSSSSASR